MWVAHNTLGITLDQRRLESILLLVPAFEVIDWSSNWKGCSSLHPFRSAPEEAEVTLCAGNTHSLVRINALPARSSHHPSVGHKVRGDGGGRAAQRHHMREHRWAGERRIHSLAPTGEKLQRPSWLGALASRQKESSQQPEPKYLLVYREGPIIRYYI